MQYVQLGKTELKVSRICLGCMSFGDESEWMLRGIDAKPVIQRALDLGINFFDTADVYSNGLSEKILGSELAERNDVVVATKVGLAFRSESGLTNGGLSRKWVTKQVLSSLSRLKRNRIDLYQIHRWDYSTPVSETLQALTELVRQGKVGYIGASAMFAWQFMYALSVSDREGLQRFVSMQDRYNLVYREEEREMLPLCKQFGIAVLPYSPLARGFLSGRYQREVIPDSVRYRTDDGFKGSYFFENDFQILDVVKDMSKERGVKPSQLALAWLLSKSWVTSVILGATKVEQMDDAVNALSINLSADEIRKLEQLYLPHQLIGPTRPTNESSF